MSSDLLITLTIGQLEQLIDSTVRATMRDELGELVLVNEHVYTIGHVALLMQTTERTVYNWIHRPTDDPQRLEAFKAGGSTRVRASDLEAWINRNRIAPKESADVEAA